MEITEFIRLREFLGKTQSQLSMLLGTSIRAIHSYEQGWREIPPHAERQMLFLAARKKNVFKKANANCWTIKKCPAERKRSCPAYEFRSGDLCWFINGTNCSGMPQGNWSEKIRICRTCEVFKNLLAF